MANYEEHEEHRVVYTSQELVFNNLDGGYTPIQFQSTFDVLKELDLDKHISEDERRFLRVQ